MDTYEIQLTRGEILWLGRAFNIITFPMLPTLGDPLNTNNMEKELAEGLKTLTNRGLIKEESRGKFKIETLAYAIIDWLAQPDSVYSVESCIHEQKIDKSSIFFKENKVLKFTGNDNQFFISLYPDKNAYIKEFSSLFQKKTFTKSDIQGIKLPSSSPFDLIKLAHTSQEKIIKALRVSGLSLEQATQTAQWLKTVKIACLIDRYQWNLGELELFEENLIFQEEQSTWIGQSSKIELNYLVLKSLPSIDEIQELFY